MTNETVFNQEEKKRIEEYMESPAGTRLIDKALRKIFGMPDMEQRMEAAIKKVVQRSLSRLTPDELARLKASFTAEVTT